MTAIVDHPDHLNTLVTTTPYVLLTGSSFDADAVGESYMKLEIRTDRADNVNRFSSGYTKSTEKILNSLEDLGYVRAELRDKDQRGAYQNEIDENKKKLEEAEQKLKEARELLDEKAKEISEGEKKLADAKAQLDEAKTKIEDGKKELDDARKTLDGEKGKLTDGKARLDEAAGKLSDAKRQLTESYAEIDGAKTAIRNKIIAAYITAFGEDVSGTLIEWAEPEDIDIDTDNAEDSIRYLWITKNLRIDLSRTAEDIADSVLNSGMIPDKLLVTLYETAFSKDAPKKHGDFDYDAIRSGLKTYINDSAGKYRQLTDGVALWRDGYKEYKAGLEDYKKGLEEYEAGKALYDEAEARYSEGVAEYEKGLAEYNENKDKYDHGVTDIEDGKKQFEEGEQSYADAEAEYNDGKEKIEKAQRDLDGVDPCRWIAYDCRGNASFVQLSAGSGNFSNLKSTFSVLFVVVGALVIFATVGKMVDEQRKLVGTTKALGFFNYEIFSKYLGFGVSASLIGVILGILAARFALEPFLLASFDRFYVFDMKRAHISVLTTLAVVAAGALLAAFSVWLASTKLLREPAVRLMQPKMPGVKRATEERAPCPFTHV